MFCQVCGKENPENAHFCGDCGTKLIGASSKPTSDQQAKVVDIALDDKQEPISDLMKYGVLAATVLIPFIGMIMGIIFIIQSETETRKDVGKLWLYTSIGIIVLYLMFSNEI